MTVTPRVSATLDRATLRTAYAAALEAYLVRPEEITLSGAYELGRQALHDGLGPLELLSLHESAVERLAGFLPGDDQATVTRANAFLMESLSPFEMTYRRFLESNVALRSLNDALESQSRHTARRIHDGAGQILFSLQLALADVMARLPQQWKPGIEKAMQLADHLDQQLRSLSRDLHPVALDDLGLNAAVRHLLDGVATRTGLKVAFHSSVPDDLPPQIATCLYRVIHEAVTNVVRHARATKLQVSMERRRNGVRSTITDNGIGIANEGARPHGLGLRGMRDRLKGLQGELELQSSSETGTQLIVSIPLAFGEHANGN
jgi:signal transduction histidine kinase